MSLVLLRKIGSVIEVPSLSAHTYRRFQIERQFIGIVCIPPRLSLDETVKTSDIFEFGVGVQEEGGVVRVCEAKGV